MEEDAITVTKEQARAAFAQWWADYEANPGNFKKGSDLEGADSAACFFDYAKQNGALSPQWGRTGNPIELKRRSGNRGAFSFGVKNS
jgi:hypothetical protein